MLFGLAALRMGRWATPGQNLVARKTIPLRPRHFACRPCYQLSIAPLVIASNFNKLFPTFYPSLETRRPVLGSRNS